LRGEADVNGRLTLDGLYRFVTRGCGAAAYRLGRSQTPRLGSKSPELRLW
jgi:hypothetical protein